MSKAQYVIKIIFKVLYIKNYKNTFNIEFFESSRTRKTRISSWKLELSQKVLELEKTRTLGLSSRTLLKAFI